MERPIIRPRRCKSSFPGVSSSRPNLLRSRAWTAVSSMPRLISTKELRSTIYLKDKRLYRSDFAYFTLLNEEISLPGALLLGWTLQRSGTRHDIVIMVTKSIGKRVQSLLKKVFDRVEEVDIICLKVNKRKSEREREREREIYTKRMTKCNLFQFIEYKKILFVDISVYVERNIDELFELEAPAGISSFVNLAGQDKWHGYRLPQDHVTKALQLSRGIRGCLMLLTPSISLYHYCHSINRQHDNFHFIQPDEEFFSKLYINSWTHIHAKFALVPWQVNRVSRDVYGICLEAFKPWDDHCTESNGISEWRNKVMKMLLDFPSFIKVFRKHVWFMKYEFCLPKQERTRISVSSCQSLSEVT